MRRISGFSLIEMMVAFVIVGVVAAGIVTAFVSTQTGSQKLLDTSRFDRKISSVINTMARDIKRAGYFAGAAQQKVNPFTNADNDIQVVNDHCILLSYDLNKDTNVDDEERFGYRLKDNAIQYREADNTLSCTAGTWANLTDPNFIKVTALNFTLNEKEQNDNLSVRTVTISITGELSDGQTKTVTRLVKVYNDKFTQ